jgi:hypothetical protein
MTDIVRGRHEDAIRQARENVERIRAASTAPMTFGTLCLLFSDALELVLEPQVADALTLRELIEDMHDES